MEEPVTVSLYPSDNPTGELLITLKLRNAIGEELNTKEWTETSGKAKGKYVRGLLAEMPEESDEYTELARLLKSSQHTISSVYEMLKDYAEKEKNMMQGPDAAVQVVAGESSIDFNQNADTNVAKTTPTSASVDWDDLEGWGEDNVETQTPSDDKMEIDEDSKTTKPPTTSRSTPTPTPMNSESSTSDRVQEKLNELAKLFGRR